MSASAQRDPGSIRGTIVDDIVLGIACFVTFWLVTHALSRLYFVSRADELLGGMWAVISTLFVVRHSYQESLSAATSRMAATVVSFVVCLIYLVFLPFHPWAMALLIAFSAFVPAMAGRPDAVTTSAITTAVIMVVVAVNPHDAWEQPIFRFADTVVGLVVGLAAAWLDLRVLRPRLKLVA